MNKQPLIFKSTHRAKFSEIDPHGRMNNEHYLSYFMDHRFTGLRESLGWDLKTISKFPVLFVVSEVQISYIKPVMVDQEFQITSHVESFEESTCLVLCTMNSKSTVHSKCKIQLTCIDQKSQKVTQWPKDLTAKFYEGGPDA